MYLFICILYLIYNVCFPGSLQKSVVSSYHPLVLGREMKRERKAEANARVEDSIGQERLAMRPSWEVEPLGKAWWSAVQYFKLLP